MKSSINSGYDTDQVPFQTTSTSKSQLERMFKRINPADNLKEDEMLLDDQIQQFYKQSSNVPINKIKQNQFNKHQPIKNNPQLAQKSNSLIRLEKKLEIKSSDQTMLNLERTIQKLKEHAEHYQQKYQSYKSISENQEQVILKMRKQMKQNRQEYETYRNFIKGKLESYMQIKDLQIARLNQVIQAKEKQIEQMQQEISQKCKPSGMTIEIIDDRQNNYQKKLEKVVVEQEALLGANMRKFQQTSLQLYNISAQNISMKSQIQSLHILIQNLEYDKTKLIGEKDSQIKRNKKLKQMLDKAQKDISSIGKYLLGLINNKIDKQLQRQIKAKLS